MLKFICFLSLSIISIHCSDSLTNYYEVLLDKEFSLRVGEIAVIIQEKLTIKFKSVEEDSRCPIDAVCVWAGNAAVSLELKDSQQDGQIVTLNTYLEPQNIEFSNLILALKELKPYPKTNEIINPKDYIVNLTVKKKEN